MAISRVGTSSYVTRVNPGRFVSRKKGTSTKWYKEVKKSKQWYELLAEAPPKKQWYELRNEAPPKKQWYELRNETEPAMKWQDVLAGSKGGYYTEA